MVKVICQRINKSKNGNSVLITVFAVFSIVVTFIISYMGYRWFLSMGPIIVTSLGPVVEQIEKLNELVEMRVYVADVITAEGEGVKGAWLIKGEGLIGIELGKARILERDEVKKRISIQLPQPRVIQARVNHERTKTWEVKKTTWIPWKGDQDALRDHVMLEAQKLVEVATASEENMQYARFRANQLIGAYCQALGWESEIHWENPTKPTSK